MYVRTAGVDFVVCWIESSCPSLSFPPYCVCMRTSGLELLHSWIVWYTNIPYTGIYIIRKLVSRAGRGLSCSFFLSIVVILGAHETYISRCPTYCWSPGFIIRRYEMLRKSCIIQITYAQEPFHTAPTRHTWYTSTAIVVFTRYTISMSCRSCSYLPRIILILIWSARCENRLLWYLFLSVASSVIMA